jgi:hypothetical protein
MPYIQRSILAIDREDRWNRLPKTSADGQTSVLPTRRGEFETNIKAG